MNVKENVTGSDRITPDVGASGQLNHHLLMI